MSARLLQGGDYLPLQVKPSGRDNVGNILIQSQMISSFICGYSVTIQLLD
jgi:hypothetical protein